MIFKNYTFGENVILKCNLFVILKNRNSSWDICVCTVTVAPLLVYCVCFTNQIFFILIRQWHYT